MLQVGDTAYVSHAHYPLGQYDVNAPYAKDPARRAEYTHEGRIKKGHIEGRHIQWMQDVNPGFTPDYCNLVQDSRGFLWVTTREDQVGTAHRSHTRNDIKEWMPQTVCLPLKGRHALDAAALDDGKLYAASLLTTDGKLYGNLYDNRKWVEPAVLIADDLTTVAGDDRRLAVEFDPTQKRLHLIYVDAGNRLRYRHLDSPYRPSDWKPALSKVGTELASDIFTAALSVDSSTEPHGLVITYGKQKCLGKDTRRRTGEIYARRFDGQKWRSDPLNAELRGTQEFGIPISIGSDVWVGGGAIICPGVTTGSRTVIGVGSVVTKDVPDNVFAGGNPCRIIREINEEDHPRQPPT